jgi:hypothetical protein
MLATTCESSNAKNLAQYQAASKPQGPPHRYHCKAALPIIPDTTSAAVEVAMVRL